MYGDINLVGHVIKNKPDLYLQTQPKNGILFVIFPFETNFNFLRRQIRLSIIGCLGDLNNASLSEWRHKKVHLIFNYKSLIIRKASKLCMKV